MGDHRQSEGVTVKDTASNEIRLAALQEAAVVVEDYATDWASRTETGPLARIMSEQLRYAAKRVRERATQSAPSEPPP